MRAIAAGLLAGLVLHTSQAPALDRLPDVLETSSIATPSAAQRHWSTRDLIEVRRIRSVAVSSRNGQIAFVVQQSFIDAGEDRYGLYVTNNQTPFRAVKVAESHFMGDLSADPRSDAWTVRADVGEGVQLYSMGRDGTHPLIVNRDTALSGTWAGVIAGLGAPHQVGVVSYQWAPDGSAFWYSRLRLRSAAERREFSSRGIVYDDATTSSIHFRNFAGLLLGTELRHFDLRTRTDKLIAFVPASASTTLGTLRRDWATALWEPDSRHIQYSNTVLGKDGEWITRTMRVDVKTGTEQLLPADFAIDSVVPSSTGNGYLTVKYERAGSQRLIEIGEGANTLVDHGPVDFERISLEADLGAWSRTGRDKLTLMGARYATHDGLVTVPSSPLGRRLSAITDNLSYCSFADNLTFGACVRESVTMPPELVLIGADGAVSTIVRPNAKYDDLVPLRFESFRVRNEHGNASDGYVTYPANYSSGQSYPAVVITHARDARNRFADPMFQWDFPLQVLAQSGYFVLSVNEARDSLRGRVFLQDETHAELRSSVRQVQFNVAFDAVSTMEAALRAVISDGRVDASKAAIVGYSRGAEVATYTMSQSRMYKVAVLGDGGAAADGYWAWGTRVGPLWYRSLYGGSPYSADPAVRANYRRLAPAFRADKFAGPVLQLFPESTATAAFELDRGLKDAGIPTELVYFPDEGHVFWNPQHRAAAMQRTIDWLGYWLLKRAPPCRSSPDGQLSRWQSMRLAFEKQQGGAGAQSDKMPEQCLSMDALGRDP